MGLYRNPDAGKYLRWFALLAPMLYCDAITDAMIKGLGQQTACVRYNILTSSMDVAFLYLLLPAYGMEGYFFSFLVTHVVNFFLSVRRLLKLTGKLISPAIPLLSLGTTAVAILLAGTIPIPAIKAVAYILLLACMWFLFRVVSREDIRWLKGLIYKK